MGTSLHGSNPHGTAPNAGFAPNYILVAIIALENGSIYIEHAHFDTKGLSEAERIKKAKDIIAGVYQTPGHRETLAKLGSHKGQAFRDFKPFKFGSQHDIFFFIEGDDMGIAPENLVSFSQIDSTGSKVSENHSFFGAIEIPEMAGGRLIRLSNYFLKSDGTPIGEGDGEILYSMNIHFNIPGSSKASMIPMIIDPDTGNGQGNEP